MSTSKDFIIYIQEKLEHIPGIGVKAMFGEYALYKDGKVIGLICDNVLHIKITPSTKALLDENNEKSAPYPGAKLQYVIDEGVLEDSEKLQELIEKCANDLPSLQKKKRKK